MGKSKSSHRWLREHEEDEFVRRARQEGFRSRAVYKLQEIAEKDRLIRPGMTIIDLGAAPGGWSQYAAGVLKGRGQLIATDILPIEPLEGVDILQGDFTEDVALTALLARIGSTPADLVMSDMAPNITGMVAIDQPRSMYLVELAVDLADQVLAPGGDLLCKVFQGEGFDEVLQTLRHKYRKVLIRKPKASRPRSREVYMLARGLNESNMS